MGVREYLHDTTLISAAFSCTNEDKRGRESLHDMTLFISPAPSCTDGHYTSTTRPLSQLISPAPLLVQMVITHIDDTTRALSQLSTSTLPLTSHRHHLPTSASASAQLVRHRTHTHTPRVPRCSIPRPARRPGVAASCGIRVEIGRTCLCGLWIADVVSEDGGGNWEDVSWWITKYEVLRGWGIHAFLCGLRTASAVFLRTTNVGYELRTATAVASFRTTHYEV